ncbi:MAG: anhydro-N-acetylmuramic acid kinase [Methyloligellaceae bacterium]
MKDNLTAIGMMSGTSMDGIDIAMMQTDGVHIHEFGPTMFCPYTTDQRDLICEAIEAAQLIEDREDRSGALGLAEIEVTKAHIKAIREFCQQENISMQMVDVIGFHGQTVFHAPDRALTVQLGSGGQIYEAFGVPTVCDLRADDIAQGGQGAPLVPVYHQALVNYADLRLPVAVVNIGGVANVTWVGEGDDMLAFDTGPGNALIDDWVAMHIGRPMDLDGVLADAGTVSEAHLEELMENPYFDLEPPKSLDRNNFSFEILSDLSLENGAATLTAFTAHSLAKSCEHMTKLPKMWIVTGGGARNPVLCSMLEEALQDYGDCEVMLAGDLNWETDFIEAQAFAYLAVRTVKGLPITFPGTTGIHAPSEGGLLIGGHLM